MKRSTHIKDKYPKLYHFLTSAESFNKRFLAISIILILIIGPYYIFKDSKEEQVFTETLITTGVVTEINHVETYTVRYNEIVFSYKTEKNESKIAKDRNNNTHCVESRKTGDTIVIEYSKLDNNYARIINCYWNTNIKKKYGFYKW